MQGFNAYSRICPSYKKKQGIILKGEDRLTLHAYSNLEWGACSEIRKYLNPVSWKSKKQHTVSKSSSEAEHRAMSNATSEVTWIIRLLSDMGVDKLKPMTLHYDNNSAIHIAKYPVFHDCTKHIEIDCHYTRDKVLEGLLKLSYLPTQQQLADILTKIFPSNQFTQLLSKLGVFSLTIPRLIGDVNYGNDSTQAQAHMNTSSIRIDDMAREDQL